jgi:hypothetical protein
MGGQSFTVKVWRVVNSQIMERKKSFLGNIKDLKQDNPSSVIIAKIEKKINCLCVNH